MYMSSENLRTSAPVGTGRLATTTSAGEKVTDVLKQPQQTEHIQFQHTGPVWWISLDNDQTRALEKGLHIAAMVTGPIDPAIPAAIESAIPYIEAVNKWGG